MGLSYIAIGVNVSMNNGATRDALYAVSVAQLLFALGLIPILRSSLREGYEGFVDWASGLGYVGYGFAVLDFTPIERLWTWSGDVRLEGIGGPGNFDPFGIFCYGCLGAWILLLGIVAAVSRRWPARVWATAIIGGLIYLTLMTALMLDLNQIAIQVSQAGGVLIGPILFFQIALGFKKPNPVPQAFE